MSNKLGQPEFPSFYWKVDINLGLISFNKEWANNILDKNRHSWLDQIHEDEKDDLLNAIDSSKFLKKHFSIEFRLCNPHQNWVWVHGRFQPFFDHLQNVIGFDIFGIEFELQSQSSKSNVSRLLAAEDASRVKSGFLANMSHEIRTPLAAIIGYAELIEAEQSAGDEHSKSIDAILRNGKQLSQLVDDILDLSKIEAGHLKILPEWLTIDELIVGGIEVLSQRARHKCLELLITGAGKFPVKVFVDPVRIRQILFNIVGNAIKFTETGQVNVALAISPNDQDSSKGTLSFTVTDTGGGIEPIEQPAIFEPFVQADSSYSRRHGGTGLGLTLSRILTQALGGHVRLLSSSKDKGSVFEVIVTVGLDRDCEWYDSLGAARQIATAPETKRPKPLDLAGRQLLLVEDSQDNRALISRMLMRYGAVVECDPNGSV